MYTGERTCDECGNKPRRSIRRGLCEACYLRAYRAESLEEHPLQCHASGDTAARYAEIKQAHPGLNDRRIAELMGLKYSTLRVALSRHRRRAA